MNQRIKCDIQLPEIGMLVLGVGQTKHIHVCSRRASGNSAKFGGWAWAFSAINRVFKQDSITHWIPFPELPED